MGPPWSKRENGFVISENVAGGMRLYYEPHCDYDDGSVSSIGLVDAIITPASTQLIGGVFPLVRCCEGSFVTLQPPTGPSSRYLALVSSLNTGKKGLCSNFACCFCLSDILSLGPRKRSAECICRFTQLTRGVSPLRTCAGATHPRHRSLPPPMLAHLCISPRPLHHSHALALPAACACLACSICSPTRHCPNVCPKFDNSMWSCCRWLATI